MQNNTLNQNTTPTDQNTAPPSDTAAPTPSFPTETPPIDNGSAAPADQTLTTPPQTDFAPPTPKRRALIPTILGLVLLVVGVGAGLILTQSPLLFKQKAACSGASNCSTTCPDGTSFSDPCPAGGAFGSCGQWANEACAGHQSSSGGGTAPSGGTTSCATSGAPCSTTCANGKTFSDACPGGGSFTSCTQWSNEACGTVGSTPSGGTTTTTGTGTIGDPCTTNADCGKSGNLQLGCGQCDSGKKCGDWTNGWITQADGTRVNAACVSPGTNPTTTVAACGGAYLLTVDCSGCPTGKGKTCFTSGWSQCFNADACGFVCNYTTQALCVASPGCAWTNGKCGASTTVTNGAGGASFLGCGDTVAGGNGDACSNCYTIGGKVTCLREGSSCGAKTSCFGTSPTTAPSTGGGGGTTPTTATTAPATAQCQAIKAYDTSWNLLTTTQLSQLKAGDKVRFTVTGTTTSGVFDKARFTINGTLRPEVTTTKPNATQEFYDEYTIPAGTTSFTVTAEIHHAALNTWN